MNVVPELNLNKHPKDCKNFSLVNAKNIKISDDLSCIQNENILENNTVLSNLLSGKTLIGIIQCNTELVLFINDSSNTYIYRYDEKSNTSYLCGKTVKKDDSITPIKLKNKIIGTFTYNVNEDLIIAFSELPVEGEDNNEPIKTINLGKKIDSGYDISRADIFISSNNQYIDVTKIALCPEVKLPNINNLHYVKGRTYKGWYHFFIRYKINKVDYTQWYPIGYPILIDSLKKQNIIKYYQCIYNIIQPSKPESYKRCASGCNDAFNDNFDISNQTVEYTLNNLDYRYDKYQIGFICSSSVYQKAFKTYDINNTKQSILINTKIYEEISYDELLVNIYNYYNVKNLINYKNRLYITNYKESENNILDSILNNITLDLNKTYIIDNSLTDASNDLGKEIYDVEREQEEHTYTIPANAGLINDDHGSTPIEIGDVIRPMYENVYCVYDTDDNKHFCNHVSEERRDNNMDFYIYFNFGGYGATYRITGDYNGREDEIVVTQIYNPIFQDITITEGSTIINRIKYINTDKTFNDRKINRTLIPGGIYNFFIHFIDKYGISTQGYKLNTVVDNSTLLTITNSNNDVLFKIPFEDVTIEDNKYKYPVYKLKINVPNIPEGYIGYYLSYEKYENTIMPGIICIEDINDSLNGVQSYKPYLSNKNINFYSADLNNDKVDLNYNKLVILNKNIFNNFTESNKEQVDSTFEFYTNLNVPQVNSSSYNNVEYDVLNLRYKLGGDPKSGRNGKGTCIELNMIDDLFSGDGDNYAVYKVLLKNSTNNIYLNSNKTLIKFTDIYYTTGEQIINGGYNGYFTFNNFLVYDLSGVILDTYNRVCTNKIFDKELSHSGIFYHINKYIHDVFGEEVITKFLGYCQIPFITNKLYETKEFNNSPQTIIYYNYQPEYPEIFREDNTIGCFVLPQNSIDLFKDRFGSQDDFNIVTLSNYNPDVYHVTQFDKTIRRSKVIADETSENSWRTFPVEGYKQISENKGKITNLVGFGNTLLVHTEHSLFAFISNSRMQTMENRTIQLEVPDIFDIDYQEVFTSSLGSCGLQDKFACIADDFGYFFYDNDAHRLYRFGQNSIEEIDSTIINFLNKYKPYKVRFGLDRENTRLLLCLDFNNPNSVGQLTLSYNYKIKSFISTHSYNFIDSYFTKNKGYFITSNAIKIFNYNNITNINYAQSFKFNIICNTEYEIIKALEYIQYKLYKVEILNGDYENDPVEGNGGQRKVSYSGYKLRIFNDLIDTGEIDITTNITIPRPSTDNANDYKKPYFYLGNWNFNYLRDSDTKEHSRLHGNYYIISFIFNENNTKQRIEFESIMCNLIRNL